MARNVSETTKFLEATPEMGLDTGQPAPGRVERARPFVPELGFIDQMPSDVSELQGEPTGPPFVVLSDILTTPDGTGRTKGQIVRLSEFEPTYGTEDADNARIKANVRRLIEGGHIRVADEEEAKQDRIEVRYENETPEVRAEREKRMELERKLREAGIDPDASVDGSEEEEDEE